MATERKVNHFDELAHEARSVSDSWIQRLESGIFGINGHLDEDVERQNTGGLLLAAPLVDLYLKEIGTAFLSKLQRPRFTGLLVSKPILIPWSVMTCIVKLIISYGRPKELGEDKGSTCLTTLKKNGHKTNGNCHNYARSHVPKRSGIHCDLA